MSDHLIGNFFSQAMKWVAGENMLAWDGFEDRLRFIVQHRVAADFCSLERFHKLCSLQAGCGPGRVLA
jgi:hypothetical protein